VLQKKTTTNAEGVYTTPVGARQVFAPGECARVRARGERDRRHRRTADVDLTLKVTIEEKVTVEETPVSTEATNNANQTVIAGKDLDALPDDPDELAAALQALAGPSVGPNGGQIFIDGFSGGSLPSKDSIREIRINQNPFAAENDQPSGASTFSLDPAPTSSAAARREFHRREFELAQPVRDHFEQAAPFQIRSTK
jgi:hypothetical protein